MIQLPLPLPPPGMPELPPPGPVYQFLSFMAVVFWAVEMLLLVLPKGLQQKVNQLRFGPRWKG